MALERITASDFASLISTGINDRDQTIDTTIGSIRDLRIDPMAEVLEFQSNRVVYLSQLISLKDVNNLVPDDLDDLVYNENMVRWQGSRAYTTVYFARTTAPTIDITVSVNFPVATIDDPSTGNSVVFKTIESKTMFAATPSAYYNADNGKYELGVSVASIIAGSESKVGAYSITVLKRSISGFNECYNKEATTSGLGIETNRELADRYLLHIQGSQLGTPAGVKTFILDNFSAAEDLFTVYGESAYMTRQADDVGAVDVWLKGSVPLTRTYSTTYPGVETLMVLDRQPLIDITSVTSGGTTFVEGTDFEVVNDSGAYSRSARGQDGIKFLTTGAVPASLGAAVDIEYRYNSFINTLNSFFTQPAYYSMGMDKLYRWAEEVEIEIEGNLTVVSGNPDTIRTSVMNAIYNYINGLGLGDDVEEFDIDKEIGRIRGVGNFVWVTLAVLDGSGVGDIEIAPNQYPVIDATNIVVNLV